MVAKRFWLTAVGVLWMATAGAQNFSSEDTVTEYNVTATYYADKFVGRKTSSGEVFTQDKYTAAHHKIKFGTLVLVTNPKNGQQVIVKVNDRCPRRGVIDLTRKAIRKIGIKGSAKATMRILPQSYKYAWEHQDEIQELEENRQVLVPTKDEQPAEAKATEKPKHEAKPTTKRTSEQENTPQKTAQKKEATANTRYDIELENNISRSQSDKYLNKLPMNYRDNATFYPNPQNGKLTMKLTLSTTHKRATEIRKKLIKSFPNSKLTVSD